MTSAYAAAATGADLSSRQAEDVTSDTATADAACIRLVQGDVGGGKLNTGLFFSFVRRLTQQPLPLLKADVRKKAANPGFDAFTEKYTAAAVQLVGRGCVSRVYVLLLTLANTLYWPQQRLCPDL